jgi:hypothetical protein
VAGVEQDANAGGVAEDVAFVLRGSDVEALDVANGQSRWRAIALAAGATGHLVKTTVAVDTLMVAVANGTGI